MSTYKLLFRGDIAPGHNFMSVRQRLKELFRLDDDGLNKLFCGRAVTIKKNLDQNSAAKWQDVLTQAGAVVDVVPEDPAPGFANETESNSGELKVEPPGADVLKPTERTEIKPVDVNTDELSLDAAGADVLRPDERTPFEERVLDLSHLSISELEK